MGTQRRSSVDPVVSQVQQEEEALKKLREEYEAYLNQLEEEKKIDAEKKKKYLAAAQNNMLTFANQAAAEKFFQNHAKTNASFVATYMNEKGEPSGEYHCSNGDGRLYSGTFQPETMKNLIKNFDKIKEDPALKEKVDAALVAGNEEQLKDSLSSLSRPSPFQGPGTTPKPHPF